MGEGSGPADAGQTEVVGELQVTLSAVALGPDYPPTAISAEIGRVAVAAARVDQEYALLLHALHSGKRADWALEDVQKHSSSELRREVLQRLDELFEGELVSDARIAVQDAYDALNRRHAVMHTVWTLEGPDAVTSGAELVAALESTDPDSALSTLVGRDVDSDDWQTLHPRSGSAGPASVVELRDIRRTLEAARKCLTDLRFGLASALNSGRPAGARRVLNPETGEEVAP